MHRNRLGRLTLGIVACVALAACATRYADLPMTPTQSISGAEDALRRGEYETAVQGFSDYLSSGQETFRARAFYELAQAQYGMENYEGALDTLADLEAEYPGRNWSQPPALKGDIEYALGRKVEAILAWQTAWQRGSAADRDFLQPRVLAVLDELTPGQTARLSQELVEPDVRAMLATRAPATRAASGAAPVDTLEAETAPPSAGEGLAAAPQGALDESGARLDLPGAAGEALDESARVACLLPLTGPDAAQGQRALTGLRRAFTDFPRALLVRDTGGDVGLAAQLVTAMADEPNVLAIIGVMHGETAAAVAPLAERLQVPLLLLSPGDQWAGPYVLPTAPGPDDIRAYDAAMRVRQAVSQGARSRGAVLQHLRAGEPASAAR